MLGGLTAAARRVSLTETPKIAKASIGRRQGWQDEAWAYYDEIGEIHYGTMYLGSSLSKVVFYAGYEMDDGSVVPINSEKCPIADTLIASDAVVEMRRLAAPIGGQPELNRSAALNLEIAGEFFLHGTEARRANGKPGDPGFMPEQPEVWDVRSVASIVESTDRDAQQRMIFMVRDDEDDRGTPIDNDTETLIRIWQRHPKWSNRADCHLRGALSDCETLVLLMNQQKAEAKSRQSAGVLLVPNEISFKDDSAEGDDGEQPESDPFLSSLLAALIAPIEDPSANEAVMPLVIQAPGEHLHPDKFRLLSLARASDASLDDRIEKRVQRIARTLNLPVEKIMGHQRTTFANANQIDQDEYDDHHEPRCAMLADGYRYGFLVPNLAALGHDPLDLERVRVGFEPGMLVASPSAAVNADALWAAGVISAKSYRALKGATEDDAPSIEEALFQMAERHGQMTADLTMTLLTQSGVDLGLKIRPDAQRGLVVPDGQAPVVVDPNAESEAVVAPAQAPQPSATASARRRVNYGRKFADVDRKLRDRLQGAVEAAMDRALEKAGNRLKNQNRLVGSSTMRDYLRGVPAYRAAQQLGEEALTASGTSASELLDGAWESFGQQFKLWVRQGGDAALDLVSQVLSDFTEAQRVEAKLALLGNADQAWAWLQNALGDVGKQALFNPARGAVATLGTVGEWEQSMRVPPGLIREALAMAGGATGLRGPAGVVTPSNAKPVGGVGTGDVVMGALADGGASVDGYVWNYGPGRRAEFPPHSELDGTVFTNFDDEVLANGEGWPETPFYYPGDHDGCLCDFDPIVLAPDEGGAAVDEQATTADEQLVWTLDDLFTPDYNDEDVEREMRSERVGTGGANYGDMIDRTRSVMSNATQDEMAALGSYIHEGHQAMNASLYGTGPVAPDVAKRVADLEQVIRNGTPIPRGTELYRTISPEEFKALYAGQGGKAFTVPQFMSTSVSRESAEFFGAENGRLLQIHMSSELVRGVVGNVAEHEIILQRGAKFVVEGFRDNNTTVVVRYVGSSLR